MLQSPTDQMTNVANHSTIGSLHSSIASNSIGAKSNVIGTHNFNKQRYYYGHGEHDKDKSRQIAKSLYGSRSSHAWSSHLAPGARHQGVKTGAGLLFAEVRVVSRVVMAANRF